MIFLPPSPFVTHRHNSLKPSPLGTWRQLWTTTTTTTTTTSTAIIIIIIIIIIIEIVESGRQWYKQQS